MAAEYLPFACDLTSQSNSTKKKHKFEVGCLIPRAVKLGEIPYELVTLLPTDETFGWNQVSVVYILLKS